MALLVTFQQHFHNAIRDELNSLSSRVLTLEERTTANDAQIIEVLRERYQFLHCAYKYHSEAEDEVVFRALDSKVKNVSHSYHLEHEAEEKMFDKLGHMLSDAVAVGGNVTPELLQNLICTAEAVHTTLESHLTKEERQVFPLLQKHFSEAEQASLVWQFLCSIPVDTVQKLVEWICTSVPPKAREELVQHLKGSLPVDSQHGHLLSMWLPSYTKEEGGEPSTPPGAQSGARGVGSSGAPGGASAPPAAPVEILGAPAGADHSRPPIDEIKHMHNSMRSALQKLIEEARGLVAMEASAPAAMLDARGAAAAASGRSAALGRLGDKLAFLRAMTIYHSSAEDGIIFPAVQMRAGEEMAASDDCSHGEETELFEQLGQLIHDIGGSLSGGSTSEKLAGQLVDLAVHTQATLGEHLRREEEDMLPLLERNFSVAEQRSLIWGMLRAMPLRLLERVLPWVAAELSEERSDSTRRSKRLAAVEPAAELDAALAQLLTRWAQRGRYNSALNAASSAIAALDVPRPGDSGADKKRAWPGPSSSGSPPKGGTPMHAHRGGGGASTSPSGGGGGGGASLAGPGGASGKRSKLHPSYNPIDHVFQFHKALHTELVRLEESAGELIECSSREAVRDFQGRYQFMWGIYRAHSKSEDDIVFPALEAKEALHNVSHSYTLDHKQEEELLEQIGGVIKELLTEGVSEERKGQMARQLRRMCTALRVALDTHVEREELELWPLFLEHFTIVEQDELVGKIIGCTGADVLQEMLPWVTSSLTVDEQREMLQSLSKTTRNTMFDRWLDVWWREREVGEGGVADGGGLASPTNMATDPGAGEGPEAGSPEGAGAGGRPDRPAVWERAHRDRAARASTAPGPGPASTPGPDRTGVPEGGSVVSPNNSTRSPEVLAAVAPYIPHGGGAVGAAGGGGLEAAGVDWKPGWEDIFRMNQKQLEAAVRKVSSDANLEPQRKAYIIQNLMTSRWIVSQQNQQRAAMSAAAGGEAGGAAAAVVPTAPAEPAPGAAAAGGGPGNHRPAAGHAGAGGAGGGSGGGCHQPPDHQCRPCHSYHNEAAGVLGCEHYQRSCRLVATCCDKSVSCRFCHDNVEDHVMDRYKSTEMVCMHCSLRQPVGQQCTGCGEQMARYYCSICKLFDDTPGRDIYHCPFCNICRRGKGLGIDFFHCMTCNACMSLGLSEHRCLEKGLESNCPICSEDMFTSSTPVRALACGHLMHSPCFQAYTKSHYTCPICTKSLGDMTVYFGMLDALLAAEQLPREVSERRQGILCNDCGRRGEAKFHFVYHKCGGCGSFNTRLE